MSDLVEFIEARITEDRVLATRREWHTTDCDTIPNAAGYSYPCDCGVPERMTREADAKQRMVELHRTISAAYPRATIETEPCCEVCSAGGEYPYEFPCQTLRLLALPYADHPDYDPAWNPEATQ